MSDRWVDEPANCRDPECPYPQPSAQPEADGQLRFYACPCGYEFPVEMASQDAGSCSLGVPEHIRRMASREMVGSSQSVFLGSIGRRPSD